MKQTRLPRPALRPFVSALADFRSGKDTPRAFLERCIETISASEPAIGAFVHLDLAAARSAADRASERWREGRPLSTIDGIPVGVKDIIETIDLPTEMGSPLFAGWRSQRDAASVAALREAGAVIVGKTVTTEFAATEPRGTRNPWDIERTPGGSSSGSAAAVAAGMLSAALGTQVVGSIVRPAGYCGCIGFKPTVGAINRGGSHDFLSQSCDGVLAATLADAWHVAREISSRAGGDPGFPGLFGRDAMPPPQRPRRLAFLETPGWNVAAQEAQAAIQRACERLASEGIEVGTRRRDTEIEAVETALATAFEATRRINAWESRWPLNTYRERDASKLSRTMLDRLAEAERMTLDEYRAELRRRDEARATYARLAAGYDACVTLSAPGCAPIGLASTGDPSFAVPASYLGVPALSLPLFTLDELPLGLQLTGFEHADEALFAVAAFLEESLGSPSTAAR
jgi:Asp-tRNA(Asn)/Glu-tRNA(Gln) amidotransferase A subunit family amidase